MSYTVEVAPAARRQIRRLPRIVQKRIIKKLEALEEDPRPPGVEKLSGGADFYRLRVGDYRIIYRVEDQILWVLVLKVGDRKEVYRKLPQG